MSRPNSPQQFVLDEETRNSTSSHTDSLLGLPEARLNGDADAYPPRRAADDEKRGTTDESDLDGQGLLSGERGPVERANREPIRIPTRDEVDGVKQNPRRRPRHIKMVLLGLVSLLGTAWLATWVSSLGMSSGGPIQVILMISDGMGPASETLARSYVQYLASSNSTTSLESRSLLNESFWANLEVGFRGRPDGQGRLPLDDMLVGTSRTRSSNSLITDSAAGATAFSCALKTYNGGIGITPNQEPCGTVLEAAKRQGFATGIVATSRLTHATPASFYAHVPDRDLETEIADFLVDEDDSDLKGLPVDFAFGGGRCFFLPNSTEGSCRTDDKDLLARAKEKGIKVVQGMAELREYREQGGGDEGTVLGLFADDNALQHMDYEIDRQKNTILTNEQPSLKEMTTQALRYLSAAGQKGKRKGFFLMIEGSRIDMAGHNNDPVGHIHDMLSYQSTVQYVQQWVKAQNERGTQTMLISVSDHETGGLYPETLANATQSTTFLGHKLADEAEPTEDWIKSELFERGLGIVDASSKELDDVWKARTNAYRANRLLADAISRRAQLGWSTAGHSGVDVNLYAYGYNSTGLVGNVENTDIGLHIANNMRLNLDVISIELNKHLHSWFDPGAGKQPDRRIGLAHYHGDF
ncbi:hypothetical protein C6P46_000314 [Rhodotorula mucilaginosa]|uniref:Alkaline phosphatase n=1 Tax=Rhodotorula mucilaginosa TaxID=5537 RepID=A0A9P6W5M5_RHOMI|nr:hypothetical protein C6P46_000314 [Rhodotorula mucilaginosa]